MITLAILLTIRALIRRQHPVKELKEKYQLLLRRKSRMRLPV